MSYPNPPQWQPPYPGPPPHQRPNNTGKRLMIVGAVLTVVAIIASGIGFFVSLKIAVPNPDDVQLVEGSLTITLGDNEDRTVWAPKGSDVECQVHKESGEQVYLSTFVSTHFENEAGAFASIGTFSGTGNYIVECRNGVGAVSPPLGFGTLMGGLGVFFLGLFLAGAGVIVFIVGLAIHLARRR